MFWLVYLIIIISVYVVQNEKLAESTRLVWFAGVGIFLALSILFSIL